MSIGPELLQRIIVARFVIEQMNYHVAVVLQNPGSRRVTFHAEAFFAKLFRKRSFDFVGNGVQLATAGAGNYEKEIENGSQLTQIE